MYQLKSSLEVAVEAAARVDAVLAKKGKIKPNPILKTANKTPTELFQTEFEINDVPLTARNVLTKGITQEEINHFSGATITTRGRYIHPEEKARLPKGERPLYLFIQGPNKQSLDLAIQRIDSLIQEVMEQEKFKLGQPVVITMQTSLPGLEKVIVGLDAAPPTFDVRNKVLGPAGANLQYISNETGAIVTLRGRTSGYPEAGTGQESPEPLHICVEHQNIEVLQAARQLAFNLVETIQQEFAQLHPLPPQGGVQTVTLPPDQLPPGVMPVLSQQPPTVGGLVQVPPPSMSVPPPSMSVPPPQMLQQPPPVAALPPPGVHIPSHQGPLVPQQQANGQQQQTVVQQTPTSLPPPGMPTPSNIAPTQTQVLTSQAPPSSLASTGPQQTQAFITHTTYPAVQYIQANGQLMAVQPQGRPETQLQLVQTQPQQPGQPQTQLQLIPGVMQQPQQVTMLLQYPSDGKGGRLIGGQPRLSTPVQIQLQPGVQLINPQLLQSGQTQFQLQLQQPVAQQLIHQAIRSGNPQQVKLPMVDQQQIQLQHQILQPLQQNAQQQILQQLQQNPVQIQQIQQQQQQLQIQQQAQQQQQIQQQAQQQIQQQAQQQIQQQAQQQIQQQAQQQIQQQAQQQIQQQAQQQIQQQAQQQIQQQAQQQIQQQAQQQIQQQAQQQIQQQAQKQSQQQAQQQIQHQAQQQIQHHSQQQIQQQSQQQQHTQQQAQQQPQIQQVQQQHHIQQLQQQIAPQQQMQSQPAQQQMPPHQPQNTSESQIQQQLQHQKEMLQQQISQQVQQAQNKDMGGQKNQQQIQKQYQGQQSQPQSGNRLLPSQSSVQQQGQKRRYEGDQPQNTYQGPPKPVPPPKIPPQKLQVPATGVGTSAANTRPTSAQVAQLLPQIKNQLRPPPPPPSQDEWRNTTSSEQMNATNRGEPQQQQQQQAQNQHHHQSTQRPTFNHYSSKPQLYNANMPFHMQGLGAFPPPPPPPPPVPVPSPSNYYPQQNVPASASASQYPYYMIQ